MSEAFTGEIRIFTGDFAPRNWAFCDGQILGVSQFQELFSLLGTIYGGDGRSKFGLPDMRGRIPMHQGTGPGLTPRAIGTRLGYETIGLSSDQIPEHNHSMQASTKLANSVEATERVLAMTPEPFYAPYSDDKVTNLLDGTVGKTGGGEKHENRQPCLALNYIICIRGIYPSRN